MAIIFIYCTLLLVNPPQWLPTVLQNFVRDAQGLVVRIIGGGVKALKGDRSPGELVSAIYFLVIACFIPVFVARIAGRRLPDLGWRWPNRLALRYFIVALAISSPFLFWMVNSPTIGRPYLAQLDRLGFVAFAAYYLVNMFTEHLLLHGVVLGLARPDGRWPDPAPVPNPAKGLVGILRWLGLANPTHAISSGEGPTPRTNRRSGALSRWLGLATGCLVPMALSALLFGLVHLGKDSRELILAFPGGLAQAYIAYRSRSWLTPFAIHLATASMALAMMLWMR